jgi:dUTPase
MMPLKKLAITSPPLVKKRITVLGGVIDPDYQGEIDCFSKMEVKRIMCGVQEIR